MINCLFIGLPVQIALFGPEALPYFLLYYIGNTISVWLVGVFLIELDPLPNPANGLGDTLINGIGSKGNKENKENKGDSNGNVANSGKAQSLSLIGRSYYHRHY